MGLRWKRKMAGSAFGKAGRGTWEVDETVDTFGTRRGLTMIRTPIKYTVEDEAGAKSNEATRPLLYVLRLTFPAKSGMT